MCSLYSNEYSNYKLAEATMGRGLGIVLWSDRDEQIWVMIHICMETTQRVSLYSYPYLKLAKYYILKIIFYVFSSAKLENKRAEQNLPGGGGGRKGKCLK
jgi:hypothetical protein